MAQHSSTSILGILAVFLAFSWSHGQTVRRYDILVAADDPVPSLGPGVELSSVRNSVISASGGVAMIAGLRNNGQRDKAILSGWPGGVEVVAVHGTPAPGRPGETFNFDRWIVASSLSVCPDGTVAFLANVDPSGDEGLWTGSDGTVEKVIAMNDEVSLGSGVQVKEFWEIPFVANGDGQIVVRAKLEGVGVLSGNDSAVWTGRAGDLTLLHREGQDASPFTGGLKLGDVTSADLSMNARGEVAFEVLDKALGLGGDENSVLMTGTREGLQVRLREGDPVPGHPGRVWGNIERPQLANDGTVTFFGRSFAIPSHLGIQHPDGSADILATDGVEAVGSPGLFWDLPPNRSPYNTANLGGRGTAAFVAGLGMETNFHRDGVWLYHVGELQLVARKFQPAPGDPGETFLEIGGSSHGEGPAATEDGVVVFWSETSDRKNGYWRWHAGDLQPLVLAEDLVEWRDGSTKEILWCDAELGGSGQSGEPSGLNDRGQFVFTAYLIGVGHTILMINNVMDRDGDGVECLVEEAFGGDPDDPGDQGGHLPQWNLDGASPELSYLRKDDGNFGYEVECSSDLEDWTMVDVSAVPSDDTTGVPAGMTRMQVSLPGSAGGQYFRVRVTRLVMAGS